MWYSRIKIAQENPISFADNQAKQQYAKQQREKIINQALQYTGIADLNSMAGVPQWQNANNYITQQVLNPQNRFINTQLLEQEWEQAKQNLINQYNLRNYPQISQKTPARTTQLELIDKIIAQAKEIHQRSSGSTGRGTYQLSSGGWDFINRQIAKNDALTPESKEILKRKFAQEAEYLFGQRERSMIQPNPNFDATKLKPADQQLARRLFQTNDLRNLTVEQKDQFLEFKNRNSPAQQQSILNQERELRQEKRFDQSLQDKKYIDPKTNKTTDSNEYNEFATEINGLTAENRDRVPALIDEINYSYLTQNQKNSLKLQLKQKGLV
jgi:hypothetical protein